MKLDSSVRSVALQFSFANTGIVPSALRRVARETPEAHRARKARKTGGSVVIEPTEKCSVASILEDLEAAGYELVHAFSQERLKPDPRGNLPWILYNVVHFGLVRKCFVRPNFAAMRNGEREAFMEVCFDAAWRVRAFSNPFCENGEEVPGQHTVSINFEARVPLYRPDGQPVTVWQKDESGKRVGEAPVPLKPDYDLRIVDGAIRLVSV